jgi:hypothetical protein
VAVVKCLHCGAVATAKAGKDGMETTYGASFRENCSSLPDRAGAGFVSTITECPFMDIEVKKLAVRLARRRAAREKMPVPKMARK